MDFNSIISTLTSSDSLSQLSSMTGTSEKDVSSIMSSVLPQLLSGAQNQATNQETAASFANALTAHSKDDSDDLTAFLANVDQEDGQKIVNHLLGQDNAVATAESLSAQSGVSASNISSIISMAAPLLMSLLGKQATSSAQAQANNQSDGFDLSGIVGSLFGGDDKDGNSGGGLGSLLSGLFK